MKKIKYIIKNVLGSAKIYHLHLAKRISIVEKDNFLVSFLKIKIINNNCSKPMQISKLLKKCKLNKYNADNNKYFYYTIDFYTRLFDDNMVLGNLTIDYKRILNNSLEEIDALIPDTNIEEKNMVSILSKYIDRIVNYLEKTNCDKKIIESINGIKNRKANGFVDALQRILFINQVSWQTNHNLMGLGRLDYILDDYYEENELSKKETKEVVKSFLSILYSDYYYKSSELFGDTGQIIILGGSNIDGTYFCNDLTYLFIECVKELQYPDPKILLRVNKKVPKSLIKKSLDCIKTGIGCPLFANDDVIIPKLINYGYDKIDSYNYCTAACWEPFIAGKSSELNNIKSIVFINPLETLLVNENLEKIHDFDSLMLLFNKYIKNYMNDFIDEVNKIKYAKDPLLSLFTDDCLKKCKDISEGAAKYNNFGFTGVGLPNLVNSLLNIKKIVFDDKKMTLKEFNKLRINNFNNDKKIIKELKNNNIKYGQDNKECIELTNKIIKEFSKTLNSKRNPLGGKYKFGLSSPSYINESKNFAATFDGRKNNEPFAVHISCDLSNAYTELVSFASKLDYSENRFNGNVVDFFVSPNFIEDNYEKFLSFLILSINVGFFEMQMNVVNSKTLIEARNNPEKFPNLIVRVWGFSAYFKDLPNEYKDYIIERALKCESISN